LFIDKRNFYDSKQREVKGLTEAMKEYNLEHGIILTNDYSESITLNSTVIEIMPVWKWMLAE